MPRLERLASRSWRFLDVMANASWTRPSVASFFTGLLPEEHGALDRGDVLSEGQRTLAERLQDAGFSTAAFVSNHAAVGRAAGFAQGFDAFHELEGRPYARAEAVSRAVVAALGQGGCPAPCFLYVHYLDPHVPYLSGGPPRGPSPSSGRAAYARELRSVDDGVASLLAGVRRHLGEQTPVLVTSDHGEEFGEHGEAGHGHSLYAEQVRLPMLLHLPGTAGGDLGARLEARDFFDLAVRLALGPPARDVSAWAEGRARRLRYASTYLTTPFSAHRPYLATVAMRRIDVGDLAMIWSGYGPTRELYAIGSDPGETVNLAADRGERLEELERELDAAPRWLARSPPAQPTEAQLEQLRALGYVR
jgi:arylsulfatase A-like enzyme